MIRRAALAAAVLVLLVPAAQAATFTPTRFDDPMPNGCLPTDCSLREAVIAANATAASDLIQLSAGKYELTRTNGPESHSYDLDVTKPLVIAGASGPGPSYISNLTGVVHAQARIFDVQATTLSARAVHLRRGDVGTEQGGCVRASDSTVSFGSGSVAQCVAKDGSGFAILDGTLTLSSSSVSKGTGSGVAVIEGTLNLTNASIHSNTGIRGACVYVGGATTSYINANAGSEIRDNEAELGGGIMVEWGANAEIIGPAGDWFTIRDNVADFYGGGLMAGTGYVVLRNVLFLENSAVGAGGGLFTSSLDLERVRVEGNLAHSGGGVYAECAGTAWPCRIAESAFAFNVASDAGGGVAHYSGGVLEVTNVSSYSNAATRGGGFAAFGSVILTHVSSFTDEADIGPSFVHIGSPGTLQTSRFRNSAMLMGCATQSGGSLVSDGNNAQLFATPSCNLAAAGDMPALTLTQANPTYGAFGGGMNVVGLNFASVLVNSSLAIWCEPTDVRGFLRPAACDIGAFEVGGVAP